MVKSTPINQLPQDSEVKATPTLEEINMEDLIKEKETQDYTNKLQDQIDLLKQQIESSKQIDLNNMPNSQSYKEEPKLITESIINKNSLTAIINELDYVLFFGVLILSLIINSTTVYTFLCNKLEIKQLGYLTKYIQSVVLAITVVVLKKN